MTDRELLELAAKAARYRLDGMAEPLCASVSKGAMLLLNERGGHSVWNPLTDDGDALRLAVKLRLELFYETGDVVTVRQWWDGATRAEVDECLEDVALATRRAIVRAAAEIGRTA
jgi:hypothetical protein